INVRWVAARFLERDLHRPHAAFTTFGGCGDVKGVVGGPVAGHLGVNVGTALSGMALGFKNDGAATLRHDEPITTSVKGPRSALGFVVAGGKSLHGGESSHADRGSGSCQAPLPHG